MKALTLETLLKHQVSEAEFNGSKAYFRQLTVKAASEMNQIEKMDDQMIHIIANTLCDECGNLLFNEESKNELYHQPMSTIGQLSNLAMKFSGILKDSEEEKEAVKI